MFRDVKKQYAEEAVNTLLAFAHSKGVAEGAAAERECLKDALLRDCGEQYGWTPEEVWDQFPRLSTLLNPAERGEGDE